VALPAFAAARLLVLSAGQQSIDISCSIAGPTAAECGGRIGRTDNVPLHNHTVVDWLLLKD